MVAVQVGNKNAAYALVPELVAHELQLCTFATIDQENIIPDGEQLCRWMTVMTWRSRIAAQNGDFELHRLLLLFFTGQVALNFVQKYTVYGFLGCWQNG